VQLREATRRVPHGVVLADALAIVGHCPAYELHARSSCVVDGASGSYPVRSLQPKVPLSSGRKPLEHPAVRADCEDGRHRGDPVLAGKLGTLAHVERDERI